MSMTPLKSDEAVANLLAEAAKRVSVGSLYAHYKHPEQTYLVKELAYMRYGGQVCVIYEAQYGPKFTFVRTLDEWFIPGDNGELRFQKL